MRAPYFWSAGLDPKARESAPLTRILLTPAAWLYAYVTRRRLRNTQAVSVAAAVICVGNISVGGTGKSPIVRYVRDYFTHTRNQRAASLSRGYGGKLKGPVLVDRDVHTAEDVGDEPRMLAENGLSWIGADRAAAGRAMAASGVDVIIMDDGHQNPSLAKDLSLIVVDSQAVFGNGHVIPKGPLREPIHAGLARADAIILIGPGPVPDNLTGADLPLFRARLEAKQAPPSTPLIAFAGIGRPEKFFDSLTDLGAMLCDAVPFPDHHAYSQNDLDYLHKLARDHQAKLITTEKDLIRLTPDQREAIISFPVEIHFETPEIFHQLLDSIDVKPQI